MVISTKMTYLMLFTFILALVIQRALSNQTEFRSSSETLSDEVLQKSKGRRLSEGIIESAYGKMNQVSRRTNKNVAVEKVNNGIPQEDFRSTNKKATRTTRGLLQEGNSFHDNGFVSPSNGTDVLTHPIAVIKCANQTLCVRPKLQLQEMYDVYYCKHVGHGVRFYFLVKEGLLLHPNIRMVDDINKAQMIVYLPVSAPWEKSECNDPELKSKTIVLDEGDGPHLFEPHGAYGLDSECVRC